jgi:glycosyltransferase involved in cell wall biosynthesis
MQENSHIRFSVIIPAYNAAATIERALDSCFIQTYAPDEIIVVNDASTDDTQRILEEKYGDRITLINFTVNNGASVARNKGLDRAQGNYIAFLDADDVWHRDKLFLMKTILEAQEGIDFLFHPFTLQDINTVKIPEGATIYQIPFIKLLLRSGIGTPCVVMKNDRSFRFNDSMRYAEDYDLWLRIAYRHKIHFIDVPLTQIGRPVLSKGGLSANKWAMRKGEIKAFTRLSKLNPLFIGLLPILYTYSFGKHIYKAVFNKY